MMVCYRTTLHIVSNALPNSIYIHEGGQNLFENVNVMQCNKILTQIIATKMTIELTDSVNKKPKKVCFNVGLF